MADWFRSWHGAPTDPKWLGIAKRAGVAPGIAVAVAWALMDRASQSDDRGNIEGYDADGLGCFFGCEPEQVDAIVAAMEAKGVVEGGRFTSWEKRQPKREFIPGWSQIRAEIFARDNYECQYCGSRENLHCDHVLAKSRGGADTPENLVTACQRCNTSKGAKLVEEWIQ